MGVSKRLYKCWYTIDILRYDYGIWKYMGSNERLYNCWDTIDILKYDYGIWKWYSHFLSCKKIVILELQKICGIVKVQ